jgi:signal transduction histidine kinase
MGTGWPWILALTIIAILVLARIAYRRGLRRGGRDSLHQVFAIIDRAPVGMVLLDCDAQVLHSNPVATTVLPSISTALPQVFRELVDTAMLKNQIAEGPSVSVAESRWRLSVHPPRGGPMGDVVVVSIAADASLPQLDGATAVSSPSGPARQLSGQLIMAQEAERTRIARQLHDAVNQDLATLAIHLSSLKRRILVTLPDCQPELEFLQKAAVQVSEDIRTLSHELHPGVLRHVGLSPALRAHCVEFARGHQMDVRYTDDAGSIQLPESVQLCLYRVAQEAMRNVVRHARASRVEVRLSCRQATLELRITDNGRGFDLGSASGTKGLGLLSMDERVRLIGGRILLQTKPGQGTDLCVVTTLQGGSHVEDFAPSRG